MFTTSTASHPIAQTMTGVLSALPQGCSGVLIDGLLPVATPLIRFEAEDRTRHMPEFFTASDLDIPLLREMHAAAGVANRLFDQVSEFSDVPLIVRGTKDYVVVSEYRTSDLADYRERFMLLDITPGEYTLTLTDPDGALSEHISDAAIAAGRDGFERHLCDAQEAGVMALDASDFVPVELMLRVEDRIESCDFRARHPLGSNLVLDVYAGHDGALAGLVRRIADRDADPDNRSGMVTCMALTLPFDAA